MPTTQYGVAWRNIPAFGPRWLGPMLPSTPDLLYSAEMVLQRNLDPDHPELEYKIVKREVGDWEDV